MVHLDGFEAVLELQVNLEVGIADVVAGGDSTLDDFRVAIDVDEAKLGADIGGEVAGIEPPRACFKRRIENDRSSVAEAFAGANEEFIVDGRGFVAGVFGRLEEFLPHYVRPEDVGVQSVRDGAGNGGFADAG